MNDVMVLIPSLNPNKELMKEFIKKLKKEFKYIMVVNDGSDLKYEEFFDELEDMNVKVITNYINLGKGRSLKYGYNEILNNYKRVKYIVTADCDGQHTVKDIILLAKTAQESNNEFIIGARNFKDKNVPIKSRFGNKLTRWIFKVFLGLNISDTQTGLRAFSTNLAKLFMRTKGERFEYETNVLIETREKNISIKEVPIETIYIDDNRNSHFNPIKDSVMIYQLFIKYILTAVSSFVIDILLFWIFNRYFNIMLATIFARIISSYYNYLTNAKYVFKRMNNNSFWKYILLVMAQMNISGLIVSGINYISNTSLLIIKIIVDGIIFFVNYFVQREWIFKNKGENIEKAS